MIFERATGAPAASQRCPPQLVGAAPAALEPKSGTCDLADAADSVVTAQPEGTGLISMDSIYFASDPRVDHGPGLGPAHVAQGQRERRHDRRRKRQPPPQGCRVTTA